MTLPPQSPDPITCVHRLVRKYASKHQPLDRRQWLATMGFATVGVANLSLWRLSLTGVGSLAASLSGCSSRTSRESNASQPTPDLVWGKLGLSPGRFQKPRAMVIDQQDLLYVVDKTGRVQVFDGDGQFVRMWRTPAIEMGKPTGLGVDHEGNILVADTHYFRILFYTNQGELIETKTIGGTHGPEVGQFAFVTDAIEDAQGNIYTSEYGEFDRIQKYAPNGEFICRFGQTGTGNLEFSRPQSLAIDPEGNLWISDACNHRLQIIRCDENKPEWIRTIGGPGIAPGEFRYPYGFILRSDQTLRVAEFGNHRIQTLDFDGKPLGMFGLPGRGAGELDQPWTLAEDSQGRLFVLDTGNNRIQRFSRGSV